MAYLTSTAEVTNTFTVGNVTITMDEAAVDVYGDQLYEEVSGGDKQPVARRTANTYKLIPGHNYTKDPTIHVASGSEKCYLFVKVENGISELEDSTTIATQMSNKGWKLLSGSTDTYYYDGSIATNGIIDAGSAQIDVLVFDDFTLKGDANVASAASAQIKVTAYAVQADGFSTPDAAWAAYAAN